jgi:hypothetical protein
MMMVLEAQIWPLCSAAWALQAASPMRLVYQRHFEVVFSVKAANDR